MGERWGGAAFGGRGIESATCKLFKFLVLQYMIVNDNT